MDNKKRKKKAFGRKDFIRAAAEKRKLQLGGDGNCIGDHCSSKSDYRTASV